MIARIGRYVHEFLQPLVATPSYIRDTTQVINLLSECERKEDYIFATADVASLYTVISHQHGLEAVKFYLEQDHSLSQVQRDFIIDLVFATGHNYFWFGGNSFYKLVA